MKLSRHGCTLAAALLAGCWAHPVLADVKAGVDAWTAGDFSKAVAEWQGPADAGDTDAMFNLAQAYKLGRGVPQDLARAEQLFGRAAELGHLHAADNFGLLLFQRGERARALPYLSAAADRGDPRAQYLMGIASYNGDSVPKDWVRAYALVSLARQAGLPQAATALSQMDEYVPLEQRQRAVAMARELAQQTEATRARQLAARELGLLVGAGSTKSSTLADATPRATVGASRVIGKPRTAPDAVTTMAAAPGPGAAGIWRVQLGAFAVKANVDTQWAKARAIPALAGHPRLDVPEGRVIKLQAAGFATLAAARAACAKVADAGIPCLAVRN